MKRYLFLLKVLVIGLISFSCENTFVESKVKIVLTGSVHGQLDPCGWKKNPLGGLSRKYVAIKQMRDDGQNPIVLDAGDMFFSTTSLNKNNLESEKHRCETMLSGYEKIGCDGLNIWKYELLGGLTYLKSLNGKHPKIPFISAKLLFSTAEIIFLVYFNLILSPSPYDPPVHPVFISQTLALCFFICFPKSLA